MKSYCKNSDKKSKGMLIGIIAGAVAVVGGLVAVALFIRKKARALSDDLYFDGSIYYEGDDCFDAYDEKFPEPKPKNEEACESFVDGIDDSDIKE